MRSPPTTLTLPRPSPYPSPDAHHLLPRPGTVNGYAVLSYMPPAGSAPVAPALPTTPAPQPGTVAAWTIQQVNQVRLSPRGQETAQVQILFSLLSRLIRAAFC